MKQHTDQLFVAISYSYGEFINAHLELLTNSLYFSTPYLDEETFQIQQGLKQQFNTLPQLLSGQASIKEECATTLLTYRSRIEEKYRTLIAYQRELTHLLTTKQAIFSSSEAFLSSLGLSKDDATQIDYAELAKDCCNFIFEENKAESRQKRANQLLPLIPIKITKDNYLQYVKSSMLHIAIEDNADSAHHLTSILKQLFDGKDCPNYGKNFTDIKVSIEALNEIDDQDELFEEADLLNETLETLLQMLNQMFKIICTLSTLLLFDELDFTDLTEFHMSFSDFYYSIKSIYLQDQESELLLPTLRERLDDVLKELKANFYKIDPKTKKDPLFNLIEAYLSMNLEQLFGFSMVPHIRYSSDVLAVFDEFIAFLRNKLSELPTAERKYRMQYLISNIPFVMSASTFETYVTKAFTNMKYPALGLVIGMQLDNILEKNGFFPEPKEEPIIETDFEEDDAAARFLAEHDKALNQSSSEDFYNGLFKDFNPDQNK